MKWLFLDLPVKRVKWITTVSEKTKQEIVGHTNCDPNKIFVIDNPVDSSLSISDIAFNKVKPTLLFLGTNPNKNLENCIAAVFNLQIKFRIIGEITRVQEILLKKFRIDYSVMKHLDDNELRQEYNQCDIVLFPSFYEGFGLPVIEAFAVGKPVITSNLSPMKEIARDGALYVNPHSIISIRNAVQQLIASAELRNEKVLKGFEIIKSYHAAAVTSKYQLLWEKVEAINSKAS